MEKTDDAMGKTAEFKAIASIEHGLSNRPESGPVTFIQQDGQPDWTGLFLRGDDAMAHAMAIRAVWDHLKSTGLKPSNDFNLFISLKILAGVYDDIMGGVIIGQPNPPKLSEEMDAMMKVT